MKKIKLTGEIDSWGYARYLMEYELSQVDASEPIILEVDSLGGDVMEAISISNMLKERGNVTAHIVGFCASAATWLCYACDKVVINDDCAYLIHKCSSWIDAWGLMNADELEQLIDKLKSEKKSNEAIDLIIANKYAKHSGGKLDIKGALKLMKEERWMLPEEALELGLVDEVSTEHVLAKSNMAARLHVMNKIDLPPLPEKFTGKCMPSMEDDDTQRKSIAQQVKDALKEFFGGAVARLAPVDAVKIADETPQKNIVMNEEFTLINALLGRDSLEESDGRITLTVEDLQKLNSHMGEMDTLRANVATLTTERDTARQELTDATTAIDSISDEIAGIATIGEKVAAIKNVLSKAAGCDTEIHAENEGNGHAAATDPVNRLVQPYRK